MGYTKNAIAGFSAQSLFKVVGIGVTGIKLIILARLLSPEAFGLFSLTTIALGITEAVTQTGINFTIINSQKSVEYFINTAWVIAIVRGFIIGSLMILIGLGLTQFFDEPLLLPLIALASLVPVIKGFINPAIVKMRKGLQFFSESAYFIVLAITEAASAVIIALIFQSVFALVFAMIVAAIVEVIISQLLFKPRPLFSFNTSRAQDIFKNAKWLSLSAGLEYIIENVDNFLLGRLTSVADLGIYHNAYGFSHKLNYETAKSANHSLLPIVNKFQRHTKRLRRAYLRTVGITLGLGAIISLPVLIAPTFFVDLLLGDQWLAAGNLMRPLILAGLLQSWVVLSYTMLITKKVFSTVTTHQITTAVLLVLLLLVLTPQYGLTGGVWAVALARALPAPILIFGLRKVLT